MSLNQRLGLGDLLQAAAERNPEKTALICREEAVTYAELDRSSRDLARWFLAEGLKPGDRVVIHRGNSLDTARLLLACLHAGLVAVPMNIRLKALEAAYVLGHARPAMCFSQPELAGVAETAVETARTHCPGLPAIRTQVPGGVAGPPLPPVDDGAPALILYTSGTTARPKGVTHTHRSLKEGAKLMGMAGLSGGPTALLMVPLMHASGLTCALLPGLLDGATIVLIPAFDPAAVLDAIERHRCTFGLGLPAMMQLVVQEQALRPREVGTLRTWLAGGDAVPLSLQRRFQELFGIPLLEVYGMTEMVPMLWNAPAIQRPGSLGKPVDCVRTRVLDLSGRELVQGEIGELAVHSPANFIGYWDSPQATADSLQDGWLMTGDLVRRDADGFLWFEGRKKEIIIRCGSNISPQEVEEALYQHPAVLEVGVIGAPDAVLGERVVACVALRAGHAADQEQLKEFVRQRLADYKVPETIVFLRELPKGITGKVQRRALKDVAVGASAAG